MMMKHNIFKETPRRFHNTVEQSIEEAAFSAEKNRRPLSRPVRVVLAALLVAALLPSAVFGASKLYGLISQKEGVCGVLLRLSSQAKDHYPEYVKLIVHPPEGFETRPNLGEEKYCRVGEEPTNGFSMALFRLQQGDDTSLIERDVESLTETVINGHPAFFVTPTKDYGGWDRLFLYYDKVNVTMLLYYHDVTEEELLAFVEGISFIEGTQTDHTYVSMITSEPENKTIVYGFDEVFREFPADTVVTYRDIIDENQKEVTLTSQISDIRVTDHIASLDRDDFNPLYPYEELADENGRLLPKTIRTYQEGDGINTPSSEIIREDKSEQVMVLADITYSNLSDTDVLAYIDYWLNTLIKNEDGSFSHAEVINSEKQIYADAYCDTERTYQSEHSDHLKAFYSFPLSAHETKTVTIGFRCNKDALDNAYLFINNTDASIERIGASEDLSGFNRCIFKVK